MRRVKKKDRPAEEKEDVGYYWCVLGAGEGTIVARCVIIWKCSYKD